jgi:hypothetical protein
MIVIDPETGMRPARVISLGYLAHLPLRFKETCFGLLAEGDKGIVRGFIRSLQLAYPSAMIYRRRWYNIGDTRICGNTFTKKNPLRRAAGQVKKHSQS